MSRSLRGLLRLPSRIALLLGFGALSVSGAQASVAESDLANNVTRVPQQSAKSFGELAIWSDGGRIYVSEAGGPPQELRLGDTAEARELRTMLEGDGGTAGLPQILLKRIILVGGGGDGFHWAPPDRNRSADPLTPPAAAGFGNVNPTAPPRTTPPANTRRPGKPSPRPTEKG